LVVQRRGQKVPGQASTCGQPSNSKTAWKTARHATNLNRVKGTRRITAAIPQAFPKSSLKTHKNGPVLPLSHQGVVLKEYFRPSHTSIFRLTTPSVLVTSDPFFRNMTGSLCDVRRWRMGGRGETFVSFAGAASRVPPFVGQN